MPYRRSQEGPPAPWWEPGQSRLQQERPEAGTGPESQAGWAQRAEEGKPGELPGQPGPGSILTLRGCPGKGHSPLRTSLPGKELGTRSANPWTTQLWREAVPGGRPCDVPPPPPRPPLLSSVQPLLVTVGIKQEGTKSGCVDPVPFLKSPGPGTPRFGKGQVAAEPLPLGGRRQKAVLSLCPPQTRLPEEPCQVQREPCSFQPLPHLSELSSVPGVERQLSHPYRPGSGQKLICFLGCTPPLLEQWLRLLLVTGSSRKWDWIQQPQT